MPSGQSAMQLRSYLKAKIRCPPPALWHSWYSHRTGGGGNTISKLCLHPEPWAYVQWHRILKISADLPWITYMYSWKGINIFTYSAIGVLIVHVSLVNKLIKRPIQCLCCKCQSLSHTVISSHHTVIYQSFCHTPVSRHRVWTFLLIYIVLTKVWA